ncbi:MAG: hypothetical protein JW929_10065 [Anaerolineales bacterium]|nr:hypothetical protein [Anaerolineales bacterium]
MTPLRNLQPGFGGRTPGKGWNGLYNRPMSIAPAKAAAFSRPFRNHALFGFILALLLSACRAGAAEPDPDGALTANGIAPTVSAALQIPSPDAGRQTANTPGPATSETGPPEAGSPQTTRPAFPSCADNLVFLADLTYPDRTPVLAGTPLEKSWRVRNSGNCDWGPEYRLRWIGGAELSAKREFALYPAVAGSEAVVSILLTAPLAPGEVVSRWRAHSPLGIAFGDTLYIDVVIG